MSFPSPSSARTVRWDLSTTTLATFASDGFLATFGTMILVPAVSSGAFGLSCVNRAGAVGNFSASSSRGLVELGGFSSALFSNPPGMVLLEGAFTAAGVLSYPTHAGSLDVAVRRVQ